MQDELINEMVKQGERPDIAAHLSRILKTRKQQQIMMKYLISIREEYVSEAEVIQVAVQISERMQNMELTRKQKLLINELQL